MIAILKILRWLSLDIVTGGIILIFFIGKCFNVNIPFLVAFTLGLSIWLIYTLDHLRDVRNIKLPSSGRHQFHKQHFKILSGVVVFGTLIGIVILFFLPKILILPGIILAGISILYLWMTHLFSSVAMKELYISIIYSTGIFLYPLLMINTFDFHLFLSLFQLILIVFTNLVLMSLYDFVIDSKDGFISICHILGCRNIYILLNILHFTSILIASIWIFLDSFFWSLQLFFLMSGAVLLAIHHFPLFFQWHDRYRIIGDAIFFLPLLLLT